MLLMQDTQPLSRRGAYLRFLPAVEACHDDDGEDRCQDHQGVGVPPPQPDLRPRGSSPGGQSKETKDNDGGDDQLDHGGAFQAWRTMSASTPGCRCLVLRGGRTVRTGDRLPGLTP